MLRPRHFADMYEALYTFLQFHERPVIGNGDNFTDHFRIDRIALLNTLPRVWLQLLQTEADPIFYIIVIEHLHLHDITDIYHLAGMAHPAPRHICYVKKAVHTPKIDECAEVSDVLDRSLTDLVSAQVRQDLLAHLRPFLFQNHAAAYHDVPAVLVDLNNLQAYWTFNELIKVTDLPQRHL